MMSVLSIGLFASKMTDIAGFFPGDGAQVATKINYKMIIWITIT